MRKLIFFLLIIPVFASLGHDLYIFSQEPDKGFRLSAVGALWDKYHKESHDKWKSTIRDVTETVNETVSDLTPEELKNINIAEQLSGITNEAEETVDEPAEKPDFMEGFTMVDGQEPTENMTTALQPEKASDQQANGLIGFIGFVLEQKAVCVFATIALIAYLLNALCKRLFTKREETDGKKIKKLKRKGGGYGYSRK